MFIPEGLFRSAPRYIVLLLFFVIVVYTPALVATYRLREVQLNGGVKEESALPVYGSDSEGYLLLADNLLMGRGLSYTAIPPFVPDSFRTPGYPSMLAGWKFIFGSYTYFPLLQILFVYGTTLLVFLIGRRITDERLAFLAALLYLADPNTVLHALILLSDISFSFFFLASFYLLFFTESVDRNIFGSGLLLGIATLIRPISYYAWIPMVALFLWRGRMLLSKRRSLEIATIFLFSYALLVLPWVMRNKIYFGVADISSVKDFNLFHYNVPEFLSYQHGGSPDSYRLLLQTQVPKLSGADFASLSHSAELRAVALSFVSKEPFNYMKFHLLKTIPFYLSSGLKNLFVSYNAVVGSEVLKVNGGNITNLLASGQFGQIWRELRVQPWVALEQIFWVGVLLFAGLSFHDRDRRGDMLLLAVFAFYFGILTGPVAYARFRIPSEPFLFLMMIVGVAHLTRRMQIYFKKS